MALRQRILESPSDQDFITIEGIDRDKSGRMTIMPRQKATVLKLRCTPNSLLKRKSLQVYFARTQLLRVFHLRSRIKRSKGESKLRYLNCKYKKVEALTNPETKRSRDKSYVASNTIADL